jgi:hypothetical protein
VISIFIMQDNTILQICTRAAQNICGPRVDNPWSSRWHCECYVQPRSLLMRLVSCKGLCFVCDMEM